MPSVSLNKMDVDALLTLRKDVENVLAERGRDLERQLALLGGEPPRRRPGRTSAMKGVKVPPKYRGPDGETWAGRGAMPRWLKALIDEGHSIEEFAIGKGGRRAAAPAKKSAAKKGRKVVPKKRNRKAASTKEAVEAAA